MALAKRYDKTGRLVGSVGSGGKTIAASEAEAEAAGRFGTTTNKNKTVTRYTESSGGEVI